MLCITEWNIYAIYMVGYIGYWFLEMNKLLHGLHVAALHTFLLFFSWFFVCIFRGLLVSYTRDCEIEFIRSAHHHTQTHTETA